MEFLLARLQVGADVVRLEVTADCEGNEMLPDEVSARAALARLFVVALEDGGEEQPWGELGSLRFERRDKLDATVPLPPDPTWAGREHELITAVWEWEPPANTAFQLAVPKGEPLDTLLWQAGDAAKGEKTRWKMLIAGDRTEWFGPVGRRLGEEETGRRRAEAREMWWIGLVALMVGWMTMRWRRAAKGRGRGKAESRKLKI